MKIACFWEVVKVLHFFHTATKLAAPSKADSSERARDSITDMTDDGAQEARTPRGGISGYWNLFREGCAFAPFVCKGCCPLAAEFERLHTPCSALAATTSL